MTLKREACLIDGKWVDGDRWITVDNPATGEIIGRVPDLGRAETKQAVAAAKRAMREWSARSAAERAEVLRRYFDLVMGHQEELAALLTEEQGKPLAEARGEIAYAASFIQWFAEEARRVYGDVIPGHQRDKRLLVIKQPIGVVAAITPWNFPAAMITRKIAPALAAGCGVVVKPSELTPFTALALAELGVRAGLPDGLLNVVTGGAVEIGDVLTSSPDVAKISFTGSTATGALLMEKAAPTVKKLSLELGGNAPFIVFDDADLDAAVLGAMQSKYRNSGQTCVCANRLYVQDGVYDAFVAKLADAVGKLRPGNGADPAHDVGPLIDERAVRKVEAHVADAVEKGAAVVAGGERGSQGPRFYQPTLLRDVTADMLVAREETFGPLAPVFRFTTEEEVIEQANDTPFGLAAYVYTNSLQRMWRVGEGLEVGMVGINSGLISTEVAPFGGVKSSGLGREGSRYGIEDYVEIKYLCISLS